MRAQGIETEIAGTQLTRQTCNTAFCVQLKVGN
ncbi:hypothetical protein BLA23254_03844 [Burkholderia lata]|uniref:Uncharacterized protein n=1 Tax=Burkholderia lata (strain ATCC 17760 / DSM 23089 / LMG 22485 / NCIMB 9086 / R18194 / 383) TaxID=482957 RepID=A0A6P2MHE4_BURL3|nr:hypothetical protein BLA23254_03844 [Burkholderia lata]